ncbi:MAG TPA: glucose-6-phosphate isomerase, partial [Clostridiaceae bacterium]|nr:glucose-6-phosphate isomerase [Clostridiaceae bacterium]
LSHHFNDYLTTEERTYPRIIFAGNNISGAYLADLLDVLDHYSVSINVISKSGTTTEPAIAFRILRNYMEERYGKEKAKERIFCTTDRAVGALKHLADQEGYETFIIPDDIGGRYSVLTPVGLLPIAVAGISIDDLMAGAAQGRERFANTKFSSNDAALYAAVRTCLMRKGYEVEILVNYEPAFHYMTEWWKQLYGESDGKDNRGLFPAGVDFSTDLHSMGQFIQAGRRIMFETVVNFEDAGRTVEIPHEEADLDGLNFLAGMGMDEVNQKALQGTVLAHVDGGVPNVQINVSERTPFSCGELMYFFEIACAFGGYLNAINPFNQPGVEAYKTNMYSLLGKPGYEEEGKKLQARIDSTQ